MRKLLFFAIFIAYSIGLFSQSGDTTIIQTFEFEGYPVGSGWLAPRQGVFDFSAVEGKTFSKILAYYTLKCDPGQSPACGEWDYLSYLRLQEHTYTGKMPNFKLYSVYGNTPDEFAYVNGQSWKYKPRFEKTLTYASPSDISEYTVAGGSTTSNYPFNTEKKSNRSFYLWKVADLTAAGMSAGKISGIAFDVVQVGNQMNALTIRLKQVSENELNSNVDTTGFTTVYCKNTEFAGTGYQQLSFGSQFNWDGTSNIIIDISFYNTNTGTNTVINTKSLGGRTVGSEDNYLSFNNHDQLSAPVSNLSSIEENITVSFWLRGDPNDQPANDCIFEARDAENNRILNVHLPWSDGVIYFDAGNKNKKDRIYKAADNPQMYEGEWHHWAFVKNGETNRMLIYYDGEEWFKKSFKFTNIGDIDTFLIGKGIWSNNDNYYSGNIDEFRVWDVALQQQDIKNWMYKEIDNTHPNYSNLKLYYNFNENNDNTYLDKISNTYSQTMGVPFMENYKGNQFKNFDTETGIPNVKFIRHNSSFTENKQVVTDSFPLPPAQIYVYTQANANEKPVLSNIMVKSPTYYNNYTYNNAGVATDSTLVAADGIINKEIFTYTTNDINEEITIPWELGRYITPYGNGLDLGDGWTWIYDVTKFQHLLKGNDVFLRAGNFQELLDLKFVFIEGTPPRNVLNIKKVWSGNYQLNNFDEKVIDTVFPLATEGKMFELHTTLTGHGFGNGNNCGEFCPNTHKVQVNGSDKFTWEIIQECGFNPLYPQGGTWIYDRAGWCPGMPATTQRLDITKHINVGTDTEVQLDYDIQHDPYGNYVTETYFVTYGDYNFQNDAGIEKIIAPNNFKLNSRFNPICGVPKIEIINNGANKLTSLHIEYGITDGQIYAYDWTGSLDFGETQIIELPVVEYNEFFDSQTKKFKATVSLPNGVTDENSHNNTMYSTFETTPNYDIPIVIVFKTNKFPNQNRYEVLNSAGEVVFSRNNFQASTEHYDTLSLEKGCYELVVYDTEGDGMYNWPANSGTGAITLKNVYGDNYTQLEPWFGEQLRHQFVYSGYLSKIDEQDLVNNIAVYPNPTSGIVNIDFLKPKSVENIEVVDLAGRFLMRFDVQEDEFRQSFDCKGLNAGVYYLKINTDSGQIMKKITIID